MKIIILDEATANLDSQSDKQIQGCLREHCADKTLLMVTHRLSNVADMNKLIKMEDGKARVEQKNAIYPSIEIQVEEPESKESESN